MPMPTPPSALPSVPLKAQLAYLTTLLEASADALRLVMGNSKEEWDAIHWLNGAVSYVGSASISLDEFERKYGKEVGK